MAEMLMPEDKAMQAVEMVRPPPEAPPSFSPQVPVVYTPPPGQPMGYPLVPQQMPVVNVNIGGSVIAPSILPNLRPWTSGLCDCCLDCGSCCCGWWCPVCHVCCLAKRLEEPCWCCLGCQYPVNLFGMRAKVRTRYGIQGSLYDDLKCALCCPGLVACQIDRELTQLGV